MCILDINAAKQTASAIQAVGHNFDTVRGDLAMLHRILIKRNRLDEAEKIRLVMFHMERESNRVWECWNQFIKEEKDCNANGDHDFKPVNRNESDHPTWGYGVAD